MDTLRHAAKAAAAGAGLAMGGLDLLDAGTAAVYAKCLEYGMPYVTNMWFEASLALVVWFASCVYFTYLDVTRSPTKIQKDYWPSAREMAEVAIPQIVIYTAGCAYTWYQWSTDPAMTVHIPETPPTFVELVGQLMLSLVVGDFILYWQHRWMHENSYLRNHVHSVHHLYSAPFAWAGGWVHPLEDALAVVAQTIPAVLFCHPMSRWVFCTIWVALLIDEHSGHDVWWSPFNWLAWLPGVKDSIGGGGDPHDIHHYIVHKNYALIFTLWDQLFGTFLAPAPDLVNPFEPPLNRTRRSPEVIEALMRAQIAAKKSPSPSIEPSRVS